MECPSRVWQLHKYTAVLLDCSLCTCDYMRKKKMTSTKRKAKMQSQEDRESALHSLAPVSTHVHFTMANAVSGSYHSAYTLSLSFHTYIYISLSPFFFFLFFFFRRLRESYITASEPSSVSAARSSSWTAAILLW